MRPYLLLFLLICCAGSASAQQYWYVRSTVGNPWGQTTNDAEMNTAFGAGNWTLGFFETTPAATIFGGTSQVVFLEGSDALADELEAFLTANMATIETWVANGGRLFLNSAPNEGNGMSFGFGGVTLTYSAFANTSTSVMPGHAIFAGPNLPVVGPYNGNYHGHATVAGGGITNILSGDLGGFTLAEKAWGCGWVMFGGMTTTNFHNPAPQSSNLRSNILVYLRNKTGLQASNDTTISCGGGAQLDVLPCGAAPAAPPAGTGSCPPPAGQDYTASAIAFAPVAAVAPIGVALGDDQVSGALPLGFTFKFFCNDYTQFYVSSNGFITFDAGQPSGCCSGQAIPTAGTPNNLIAAYWKDLYPPGGGSVTYETIGAAPNRRLIVRWTTVPQCCGATNQVTTQIVLYETTNVIEIHTTTAPSGGATCTQGIENAAGTLGFNLAGRSAATFDLNNDGVRFTPYTAPTCPAPAGQDYTAAAIAHAPVAAVAPTNVALGDDQVTGALPVGFTFKYFCTDYTQFYISSNGFISFDPAVGSGCCTGQAMPTAGNPDNIIAGYWEDLGPHYGIGTISYETVGAAPNRRLVVRWNGIPHFGNTNPVTFQIVLYETTNVIEVHSTTCPSDGGLHSQGVENAAGSAAYFLAGRSNANFSMNNDGVRFTPYNGGGVVVPPVPPVSTYLWSPAATLNNATIRNPIASPGVSTTYTVAVTTGGITATDTVRVTVNDIGVPVLALATPDTICPGTNAQLLASVSPACNYVQRVIPVDTSLASATAVQVPLGDDQVTGALPIGFTFNFFCQDYTQFYISSNGFITFNNTGASGCCSGQLLPDAFDPNNVIAGYWDDLHGDNDGTRITYETVGTAPNRRLYVRYRGMRHFAGIGGAVTFTIILDETTNNIEIHSLSCTSDGSMSTQGLENADGTQASIVAGRNQAVFSVSNSAIRFISTRRPGDTFAWTGAPISNTTIANPTANPTVTTNYSVTLTTAYGCSGASTEEVVVPTGVTWSGAPGTSWFTAAHWVPACVPTCDLDVLIPNVTNDPIIDAGTAAGRNITVQAGGQITMNAGQGLQVCGNYNNAGAFIDNGGTVTFQGPASQNYTHAGSSQWAFRNVQVNTVGQMILATNLEVQPNGSLNFGAAANGNGIITTGANTVLLNAPVTVTGFNATAVPALQGYNFVNGNMRYITAAGQTVYDFPVGDLVNGLQAMTLTRNTPGTDAITRLDANYLATPGALPANQDVCGVDAMGWTQTLYPGKFQFHANGAAAYVLPVGSSYDLDMAFRGALPGGPFWGVLVNHGAGWDYARINSGPVPDACIQPAASSPISAPGLVAFSEGTGVGTSQPFPVEMLPLTAAPRTDFIRLNWTVMTEVNNAGFEVHRRVGAQSAFAQVGYVGGRGTAQGAHTYAMDDHDVQPNVVYQYRLRQVDFDGASALSNTAEAMLVTDGNIALSVYPNPTDGQLSLQVNATDAGELTWQVVNPLGQVVRQSNAPVTHEAGLSRVAVDMTGLAAGRYFLSVQTAGGIQRFPITLVR